MPSHKLHILWIILAIVLSSCASSTPAPTPTVEPTATPAPTSTPIPTATPQPTATPDPIAGWQTLNLAKLGVLLKHPANWTVFPATSDELGQVTLITSEANINSRKTTDNMIVYQTNEFYIWLGFSTKDAISTEQLQTWVNKLDVPIGKRLGVETISISGREVVSETVALTDNLTIQTIYVSTIQGVATISVGPLESNKIGEWKNILQTIQFTVPRGMQTNPESFGAINVLFEPLQQAANFTLPFEGVTDVTCGPHGCETHQIYKGSVEAIDFALKYGAKVYPTKPGKVIVVQTDPPGFGNYVKVSHENGDVSIYAHLSKILVKQGDTIDLSKALGEVGNTGNVRPLPTTENPQAGTHLHFEVRDSKGIPVSVRSLVQWNDPNCSVCSGGKANAPSRSSLAQQQSPQPQNIDPSKSLNPDQPANPSAQLKPPEVGSPNCGVSRSENTFTLVFCGFRPEENITINGTYPPCVKSFPGTQTAQASSNGAFIIATEFKPSFLNCSGKFTKTVTGNQSSVSVTLSFNYP